MQYGMRVGWNARGGTDADHLRIDRQMAEARMHAALQPVRDALGEAAYRAWVDETLSEDDGIDQIIAKARTELARLEQDATCTCDPHPDRGGMACPACKRAMGDTEIPF